MVSRLESFLSASEIADIHDDFGRGLRTVEEFQDPPVVITVLERNPADGNKYTLPVVANLRLIRIRLDDRDPAMGAENQGAIESRVNGSFKVWANDVTVTGTVVLAKDQRFTWDGQWCVMTIVESARLGSVVGHFNLAIGRVS